MPRLLVHLLAAAACLGCATPPGPAPTPVVDRPEVHDGGRPTADLRHVPEPIAEAEPTPPPAPAPPPQQVHPRPRVKPRPTTPELPPPAPPPRPPPPRSPPPAPVDTSSCETAADCVLHCPSAPGCCPSAPCGCRQAVRRDAIAAVDAQFAATCTHTPACLAVGCAWQPAMGATCRDGRCAALTGPGDL